MRKFNLQILYLLFALSLCFTTTYGQKGDSYDPATTTYYIQNVTVIQKPGVTLENQQILVENGLIKEIGSNLKKPGHAKDLKWDSMYVYAGFIDAYSNIGIPSAQQESRQQGGRGQNQGQSNVKRYDPTNKQAGITPEVDVRSLVNPKDKSVSSWREQGFTVSHTIPKGNFLPGQGSIILLQTSDDKDEMIIRENLSQNFNFRGSRPVYPSTVIAVMSKWREFYTNAALSQKHHSIWKNNPGGTPRPQPDEATKALNQLVEGDVPLFVQADNTSNISKAINLQKELGYSMVLAGIKDPGYALDILKNTEYPLVLSLDMPDKPKEKEEKKKDGDKEKEKTKKDKEEKKPSIYTAEELKMLEERKVKSYDAVTSFPAQLNKMGASFSFCTMGSKSKDFRDNLNKIIDQGLESEKALAALTTEPAMLLGLNKIMGTVEKGKLANLVVTDKPFFEKESKIEYVMVDGKNYEYKSKSKEKKANKPGDAAASGANPHGTWEYTISIPNGEERNGNFSFTNNSSGLSGKISSSDFGDEYMELSNVELDGNTLSFDFEFEMEGTQVKAQISMSIDGDDMEGSFSLAAFGSMPISAERISETPE